MTGVDMFDARLFGISPREARLMDPQHRLLMEQSWQALIDAAIDPRALEGSRTGVFFGLCSHDYGLIGHEMPERVGPYSALGAAHCIASNHVSFSLGLRGPSMTVDAACAASALGIHLAVQSLLAGECDLALAGGANVMLTPSVNASFELAQMLSGEGRCATFDRSADGYVRGEAVGVIVLKRMEDACDDPVHAVIAASVTNQDGRTSSITVPSGEAQYALLNDCYTKAGVGPDSIVFVEAHGTGTPVGDSIEAQTLDRVFAGRRTPCLIGSLKANFGHAEAAAGVLSTIKAALALEHGWLPPHIGAPDPIAPFAADGAPIALPSTPTPLSRENGGAPVFGGVSAFGFGGSNVHLALRAHVPEQTPGEVGDEARDGRWAQLLLSAHSKEALAQLRAPWSAYLREISADDFHRLRAMSRRAFGGERFRLEIFAPTPQEAAGAVTTAPAIDMVLAGRARPTGESVRERPLAAPPPYSFVRKRFWAYDYAEGGAAFAAEASTPRVAAFPKELQLDFSADYIANHRIAGAVIVPGATIMMQVRSALSPFTNGDELEIRDMRFLSAMMIDSTSPTDSSLARMRLREQEPGVYSFALHRTVDDSICADGLVIRRAR